MFKTSICDENSVAQSLKKLSFSGFNDREILHWDGSDGTTMQASQIESQSHVRASEVVNLLNKKYMSACEHYLMVARIEETRPLALP